MVSSCKEIVIDNDAMLIDRRLNGKNKSAVNRQRFIRRYKEQIRKSVSEAIGKRSIKEFDKGEKINIPAKDISEPTFTHGSGGRRETVHPGNKEFSTGDIIPRPQNQSGQGAGSKASNSGEGVDDFVFELSREEFLEFFFDDLELPELVKTQLGKMIEFENRRAGFTSYGVPSNINIIRSMKNALARRIALQSPYREKLESAESELAKLNANGSTDVKKLLLLKEEIEHQKKRIANIPFIDTFDLRYNHRVKHPLPITQAVMFCIMDISGSMNEKRKDIAKRFFALLYLFLTHTYKDIEVVFIRHHTTAKEVDENEFFYSRETGGTVVSSALELTYKIIADRYPSSQWNIYTAQASDGDNWQGDSAHCREILAENIMPCLQYFAYIEISAEAHQELWEEYAKLKGVYKNFAMESIHSANDIYAVFRELFKKRMKTY